MYYFQKETSPTLDLTSQETAVHGTTAPADSLLSQTTPRVGFTYRSANCVFRFVLHKTDLAGCPLILQPVVCGLEQAIAAKNLREWRKASQCCIPLGSRFIQGALF